MRAKPEVTRDEDGLCWRASVDGDDAGSLRVVVRPDGRCFGVFSSCRFGAEESLLAEVDSELGCALYTSIGEGDADALELLAALGFRASRRESVYSVPTDPGLTGLDRTPPNGMTLRHADEVDEDRLRFLDDALRQDVPGTDGWRWDPVSFHDETFDPAYFDPATYVIAVDASSRAYVGLGRVWHNPSGARLGLIGVLPSHRRRGVARALLGHVFAVLHERGIETVTAEVDDANVASVALLESAGARRSDGTIELRREPRATGRAAS